MLCQSGQSNFCPKDTIAWAWHPLFGVISSSQGQKWPKMKVLGTPFLDLLSVFFKTPPPHCYQIVIRWVLLSCIPTKLFWFKSWFIKCIFSKAVITCEAQLHAVMILLSIRALGKSKELVNQLPKDKRPSIWESVVLCGIVWWFWQVDVVALFGSMLHDVSRMYPFWLALSPIWLSTVSDAFVHFISCKPETTCLPGRGTCIVWVSSIRLLLSCRLSRPSSHMAVSQGRESSLPICFRFANMY